MADFILWTPAVTANARGWRPPTAAEIERLPRFEHTALAQSLAGVVVPDNFTEVSDIYVRDFLGKEQDGTGACTGYAMGGLVAAIRHYRRIKLGLPFDPRPLSGRYSYWWQRYPNTDIDAGSSGAAALFVAMNRGYPAESYMTDDLGPDANTAAALIREAPSADAEANAFRNRVLNGVIAANDVATLKAVVWNNGMGGGFGFGVGAHYMFICGYRTTNFVQTQFFGFTSHLPNRILGFMWEGSDGLQLNGSDYCAVTDVDVTGGNMPPELALFSQSVDFGQNKVGAPRTILGTLRNIGAGTLNVSSASTNDPQFKVRLTPGPIPPNLTFFADFTAASPGQKTALATFIHDAFNSPTSFTLTGYGMATTQAQLDSYKQQVAALQLGQITPQQLSSIDLARTFIVADAGTGTGGFLISGYIRRADGSPVANVHVAGMVGAYSDANGYYFSRVDGSTGVNLTPWKNDANGHPIESFSPPNRFVAASTADVIVPDFIATAVGAGGQPVVTTTALVSSANPAAVATNVVFTATVTGANPTGSVNFMVDGVANTPGMLVGTGNSKTATLNLGSLPVGSHAIIAVYSGDAANQGSASPALSQVIQAAGGTVTVTQSSPPMFVGPIANLADGNLTQNTTYFVDGDNNGRWVRFDYGSISTRSIFAFDQSGATTHGMVQLTCDGADIPFAPFLLGGSTHQAVSFPPTPGRVFGYRGTGGHQSDAPYVREIGFS